MELDFRHRLSGPLGGHREGDHGVNLRGFG